MSNEGNVDPVRNSVSNGVNIGPTSPTQTLDVNGNVTANNLYGSLGDVVYENKYVAGYTATYSADGYVTELNITLTLPKRSVVIQEFTGNYNRGSAGVVYPGLYQDGVGVVGGHIPAVSDGWNFISLHHVKVLEAGSHTFQVRLDGLSGSWNFYAPNHSVVAIPTPN